MHTNKQLLRSKYVMGRVHHWVGHAQLLKHIISFESSLMKTTKYAYSPKHPECNKNEQHIGNDTSKDEI